MLKIEKIRRINHFDAPFFLSTLYFPPVEFQKRKNPKTKFISSSKQQENIEMKWNWARKTDELTCNTTSTAYELPFDFCEPSNFEPLYKSVFGKPNCLDCDGGGITSVLTGILSRFFIGRCCTFSKFWSLLHKLVAIYWLKMNRQRQFYCTATAAIHPKMNVFTIFRNITCVCYFLHVTQSNESDFIA